MIFENDCKKQYGFNTLHPTLFELKDNGKAMWLESDHPKGATVAYGVKFVPPKAMHKGMEEHEIYDGYKKQFDELADKAKAS